MNEHFTSLNTMTEPRMMRPPGGWGDISHGADPHEWVDSCDYNPRCTPVEQDKTPGESGECICEAPLHDHTGTYPSDRSCPVHGLPTPPVEMRQYAPYPTILADLVDKLRYRPGWSFTLEDIERDPADTHGGAAGGLTLVGLTGTHNWDGGNPGYEGSMDAYHPAEPRPVYFYFPVPAATYDERSWRRWLFERILDVERHEAMEHFQLGDERPYSPSHGPGNDPYFIREVGTDLDQRTSFRGAVKDA